MLENLLPLLITYSPDLNTNNFHLTPIPRHLPIPYWAEQYFSGWTDFIFSLKMFLISLLKVNDNPCRNTIEDHVFFAHCLMYIEQQT